jgi:hypothetical protein
METTTAAPVLFDPYMLTVLAIMVAAGLLAGIANFFLSEAQSGRELGKYIVLGIVAALTVPLFLNMTSSNLLEFGRTRPLSIFVFAGFCLVYVLLSRRVFEAIANRLLQIGQKAGGETGAGRPLRTTEDFFRAGISATDIEIMRAVSQGGSVYENLTRSGTSGALEAPPSKDLVNDRLVLLRQLGLLDLRTNEQNVMHMCLSPVGAQLLAEVSAGGHA